MREKTRPAEAVRAGHTSHSTLQTTHDSQASPGAPASHSPQVRAQKGCSRVSKRQKKLHQRKPYYHFYFLLFGPFSATRSLEQVDIYPSVQLGTQCGFFIFSCLYYANPSPPPPPPPHFLYLSVYSHFVFNGYLCHIRIYIIPLTCTMIMIFIVL